MVLFAAFVLVPLIEIALFIQIGGWLGLWPTLAVVVATAALGTILVRSQGARALADIRGSLEDLRDPTEPLAHGAMILVSGALLLTPGFFTDAVGFALLIPNVRRAVMAEVRRRYVQAQARARHPQPGAPSGPHRRSPHVIEGEYRRTDETPSRPSGWRRD